VEANEPIDGRHARRQRSRDAVLEAVFALLDEGKVPPSVDDVAARAGVSVSSIFRNFDGLHDLQRQALERSQANLAHLIVVTDADEQRSARVRSHVRSRIELLERASGLLRVGRSRALDHEPMVEGLALLRGRLADQTRQRFASEIEQLTPAEAANLVALIDATTSPEAFDLMCAAHSRTSRQIAKTWITALDALLAQWVGETPTETSSQ
jgi:TetR/AcrR family transcriptional regulator, regulator of autoinduction and epiphytic fitness